MTESTSFVPASNKSVTTGIIFRYGEVLLNFAEAAVELNKQSDAWTPLIKSGNVPVLNY